MHVDILMGMQYGSEGKGFVSALLAHGRRYGAFVRSGGPNAGHCLLHNGKEYKMRMVPCGWVDPNARLFIGPATVIRPDVLAEEIQMVEAAGFSVRERLFIHPLAAVITDEHMAEELATIRGSIGSTAEGVGACRRGKMTRIPENYLLAKDSDELQSLVFVNHDPKAWYDNLYSSDNIMLEGTQGAGLCITHGQFPYVTSWPCTAAQLCSDAGVPISSIRHIIGVVRTKPIRVAGNSGPLKGETTFEDLGQPEEHTTVTKKVRRIADDIDWDELDKNVAINRPTVFALTFGDYLEEDVLAALVIELENRYLIPVGYIGMGKDGEYVGRAEPFVEDNSSEAVFERRLDDVLNHIKKILIAKRAKYGTDNINNGGEVGIFYRAWDKIHRLKNQLVDCPESIDDEDPWLDLAGYGIISVFRRMFGRW